MDTHEVTFEIKSNRDAYMVEGLLERLYDAVREERSVQQETAEVDELLTAFAEIHSAAGTYRPGQLTICLAQDETGFD